MTVLRGKLFFIMLHDDGDVRRPCVLKDTVHDGRRFFPIFTTRLKARDFTQTLPQVPLPLVVEREHIGALVQSVYPMLAVLVEHGFEWISVDHPGTNVPSPAVLHLRLEDVMRLPHDTEEINVQTD